MQQQWIRSKLEKSANLCLQFIHYFKTHCPCNGCNHVMYDCLKESPADCYFHIFGDFIAWPASSPLYYLSKPVFLFCFFLFFSLNTLMGKPWKCMRSYCILFAILCQDCSTCVSVTGSGSICRGWFKHGYRGARTQGARAAVSMGCSWSGESRTLWLRQTAHSACVRCSLWLRSVSLVLVNYFGGLVV